MSKKDENAFNIFPMHVDEKSLRAFVVVYFLFVYRDVELSETLSLSRENWMNENSSVNQRALNSFSQNNFS